MNVNRSFVSFVEVQYCGGVMTIGVVAAVVGIAVVVDGKAKWQG